jgi:hypothetical protein
MPDRLIVTEENQLQEVSIPETSAQPVWVRFIARSFSFVFHPLFIPVYITFFLIRVHPYLFAGIDEWGKLANLLQVFVNCTFLPLASILLLRGLNFIDSIYLNTQKERIVPYMICMIFYFWNWYAFKNNHGAKELVSMSLAIFITSILGFLVNISMKVSLHAMAVGVMSTFMALLAFNDSASLTLYLSITLLLTGIVCTSRLIAADHRPIEVYSGLVIGILSQLAAQYFVNS